MGRTLRSLPALAVVAMVAVISAGCGGTHGSGDNDTATVPAGTGSTNNAAAPAGTGNGGGANSTATSPEKAVKFAACMRANGVSTFPDPDASGQMTIDAIANGSSVDTSSPVFAHALSACKNLEPPGFTGTKVTPQQTTARLEFAQCMRKNGVPDFPDPTPNGPLVDTNRIPSSNTPAGMSILDATMKKCGAYASAAGVQGNR
jgi:hypothetical protein